jgi:outer membrane protein with beta-barrel domain
MKHESRPYINLERKLEQLPGVDADHLWDDMHAILDKKMPEKREKRRFIVWFLNDRALFSIGITLLVTATAFCLFFLSPNRNSSTEISNNKVSNSVQQNRADETAANPETSVHGTIIYPTNINENETTAPSTDATDKGAGNYIAQQKKTWNNYTNTNTNIGSTTSNENVVDVNQITQQTNGEREHASAGSKYQHDLYNNSGNFNPILHGLSSIKGEELSLITTPGNKAKQNIRVQNERGFYAGIVAGLDLSSVQFQSLGTGANQGLILGYAFNSRWSIESGLLWDKKRYYDDGSNFNPPGYTPSPSVQIISVNGTNKNYELPINLRYTIIPRKNSLFATAGLSSYFMKSEHFEYEYVQNSQPGGHNYITYTNATKNWFSVVNLSLGYAHKLGSVGSLRIEPYLKIPIKNLATANMPIMSTGLNIGFTKSLSR